MGPSILGMRHTCPHTPVPPKACDCHTHVFGPATAYPFWPGRSYTPGDAPLAGMVALHAMLGIQRVVIVQPSVYGTDNRCTVDAVRALGPDARGVAVVGPDDSLADLDAAGICGMRLNLHTAGQSDPDEAWDRLQVASRQAAPLGWHVQIFTSLRVVAALSERMAALPVPVVIDHFAGLDAAAGMHQPGFDRLLKLMATGRAYLKLSAPYRVSRAPGHPDVAPLARALIAENPDRLVWGTDWPHPGAHAGSDPTETEPFQAVDDGAALDRLAEWCGNAETLAKILTGNPARLYGFP